MRRALPSLLLAALACSSHGKNAEGPPTTFPAMEPGEHLLLAPHGDPESLLGRAVSSGPNGEFVLAEARAPGCQVGLHDVSSRWKRKFESDIGQTAVASASLPWVAELRAEYGEQIRVQAEIDNQKELVADLSGPCGDRVVKSVKIGAGSRELQYREQSSGAGAVSVGSVDASGGAKGWRRIGSSLVWDSPQAWAFSIGGTADSKRIRVALVMPTEIDDGQEYTLKVSANRELWLIVLNAEQDGRVGVLLPDSAHPEVAVSKGEARPLPTMSVGLRDPATAVTERIIVFALTEREDYNDFRPPAGAITAEAASAYLQRLERDLAKLPRHRWAREEISYRIVPKRSH